MQKRPRSTFLPSLALATAATLAFLFGTACEQGGQGSFEVEIAPLSALCGAGTSTCTRRARDIPLSSCTELSLCRDMGGGTCDPLLLLRPDQVHAPGEGVEVLRFETSRFEVDLLQTDIPADLRMRIYAPGPGQDAVADATRRPLAEGIVQGVRFGSSESVLVRLYEYGRWSCAGAYGNTTGLSADLPPPRALHQAVALPNGDVLILGGIAGGEGGGPIFHTSTTFDLGAFLEPTVQVYDSSRGRFLDVAVEGGALRRVGFVATLLSGASGDGVYRIRLSGGLTAGENEALKVNGTLTRTPRGELFLPGSDASLANDAVVVYDAERRALRVEEIATPTPYAFASASGTDAFASGVGDRVALLFGMGDISDPATPALLGELQSFSLRASAPALEPISSGVLPGNVGGTVSWLPSGAQLIWGGNVGAADEAALAAGAMLRVSPTGTVTEERAALPATWPASSAFHTATEVDGDVVIVGGLDVLLSGTAIRVQRQPHALPMAVIHEGGGGLEVLDVAPPMDGALPNPTVLHTATPWTRADGSLELIVLGGATVSTLDGTDQTFFESGSAGRVIQRGGSYEYLPMPDLSNPRFGHTATLLPGDRLLVVGGLRRVSVSADPTDLTHLQTIGAAEIFQLTDRPEGIASCADGEVAPVTLDPIDSGDGCGL